MNTTAAVIEEQELLEGSDPLTKQGWQVHIDAASDLLVKEAAWSGSLFLGSLVDSWLVLALSWTSNLRQGGSCSFGLPP